MKMIRVYWECVRSNGERTCHKYREDAFEVLRRWRVGEGWRTEDPGAKVVKVTVRRKSK